jgi:hypothetical protein
VANAGGNWIFVGVQGGTGRLDITGSGSFDDTGRMWVGGSQNAGGGNGSFNVDTTGIVNTNDLALGSSGGVGIMNFAGGTLNTNGWNFIGKREAADGGDGTLNMTGGILTNNGSRTFIAQGNSTGTINISGGGNFIIAASGPGTMTQSAGVVNILSGTTWVGETNNAVGSLAISDSAEFNSQDLVLAVSPGTAGILNVSLTGAVNASAT